MKSVAFLFIFLVLIVQAEAQTADGSTSKFLRYGAYIHGVLDHHAANFGKFNDVAFCCPDNFSNKQWQLGVGAALGGLLELPLTSDNKLFLDIRLGGQFHKGTLTQQQESLFNDNNNIAQKGAFNYSISTKIGGIGLSLMPSYHLSHRLSLHAGITAQYLVFGTFNQVESVDYPTSAYFYKETDGSYSKERHKASGSIPELQSFQLSGIAGLSYEIPANAKGTTLLTPEIFYSYGITQVSGALTNRNSWKMNGLYAGISLRYSPTPTVINDTYICQECYQFDLDKNDCIPVLKCAKDEYIKMDTLTKTCKCFTTVQIAQIDSIVGTFSDGTTKKYPQLEVKVHQFRRTVMKPLLPYLFYPVSESEISNSYSQIDHSQANEYSIEETVKKFKKSNNVLTLYYDILSIIGKRMEKIPYSILTITGCQDGRENNGASIANERALIVKKYFQDTWRIPEERIVVVSGNLPSSPAMVNGSISDEKARQENRRVELSSGNSALLAPVSIDEIDREVEPEKLSYYSTVKSQSPIAGGNFELRQATDGQNSDRIMKSVSFVGSVPKRFDITWKDTIPLSQGNLFYDFEVGTATGPVSSSKNTLNVKVRQVTPEEKKQSGQPDKTTKIFDIILYDINSKEMLPANKAMINEAKSSITSKSVVRVIGFTDDIGTDERNRQLSLKRAEGVAGYLPKQSIVEIRGDGVSKQYDNQKPDGRNYNRTVRVIVETDNRK